MRFLRNLRILFILVALALPFAQAQAADARLPTFPTEQAAKQHCPTDIVVWLNIPSAIYHLKGQRWYAATKNGAYVCRKEADAGGARGSRNGQ